MTHSKTPSHLFAVRHTLDRVELHLDLRDPLGDGETGIRAVGRSETKRSALWTYQETFLRGDLLVKGYSAADALHHIALVCVQDRPSSLERLDFALQGGLSYTQDELFT